MNLTEFTSRTAASRAAVSYLTDALVIQLQTHSHAMLMTCGGSSPIECLTNLSHADLPWDQITVTLTDERLVPVSDDQSNEKMVRNSLLKGGAAQATFVPLSPKNLANIEQSKPVSLVGMGEDGHFMSIFPDNPQLATLLDPKAPAGCFDISTSASPLPRRTANLSLLLCSSSLLMLAFGDQKRRLLESPQGLPVAQLLASDVEVYWAP